MYVLRTLYSAELIRDNELRVESGRTQQGGRGRASNVHLTMTAATETERIIDDRTLKDIATLQGLVPHVEAEDAISTVSTAHNDNERPVKSKWDRREPANGRLAAY
jgi:hypothetical protein